MANVAVTNRGRVSVEAASTPKITNVVAALAATEYSHVLQAGAKQFMLRTRGTATMQFAFVAGQSGTNFITLPNSATASFDALELQSLTLYFQLNKPGQIVEILEWT